jgi:hypothetical protein
MSLDKLNRRKFFAHYGYGRWCGCVGRLRSTRSRTRTGCSRGSRRRGAHQSSNL